MTALEKIKELDDLYTSPRNLSDARRFGTEFEDTLLLLRALRVMREIAIKYAYIFPESLSRDRLSNMLENEFEERMKV